MPRRRELKDLAAGIATKFISRNNDLHGYWALGILFKDLDSFSSNVLTINLLTKKSSPNLENAKKSALEFGDYLDQQLVKRGFDKSQIKKATLTIQFEVDPTKQHINMLRPSVWGKPFNCTVKFLDDLGNEYFFKTKGWCGRHDPKRERKSTRVNILFAL